jgi:peroxiredoxin
VTALAALLFAAAALAPGFSLPDSSGGVTTLESFRGKSPVLLVVYRGHW